MDDNEVTVKPDEPKENLSPREKWVLDHGNKVPITTEGPTDGTLSSVQVKEGKNDLRSKRDDYDQEQFSINEKSTSYGVHDAEFKGQVLQAGKTFEFEELGAYIHDVTPADIANKNATALANALRSTDIKEITIQPTMVADLGNQNRRMNNGKTQIENYDANMKVLGNLIEQISGVKVTVLPARVQLTTLDKNHTMQIQTH